MMPTSPKTNCLRGDSLSTTTAPAIEHHKTQTEIRPVCQIAVFLAACLVIILRRPDSVIHAQFVAEDGAVWYASAYNYGWWRVLLSPYAGYLNLLPRIGAAIALQFSFRYGPLVENLLAIAIEAIPVMLLLSGRLRTFGTLRFRISLVVLYILLPNTQEMLATLTESQWFLAFSALLLLLAEKPASKIGCLADISVYTLCGLSSPFSLFLSPIAMFNFVAIEKIHIAV